MGRLVTETEVSNFYTGTTVGKLCTGARAAALGRTSSVSGSRIVEQSNISSVTFSSQTKNVYIWPNNSSWAQNLSQTGIQCTASIMGGSSSTASYSGSWDEAKTGQGATLMSSGTLAVSSLKVAQESTGYLKLTGTANNPSNGTFGIYNQTYYIGTYTITGANSNQKKYNLYWSKYPYNGSSAYVRIRIKSSAANRTAYVTCVVKDSSNRTLCSFQCNSGGQSYKFPNTSTTWNCDMTFKYYTNNMKVNYSFYVTTNYSTYQSGSGTNYNGSVTIFASPYGTGAQYGSIVTV